jgi:hypothetical protein
VVQSAFNPGSRAAEPVYKPPHQHFRKIFFTLRLVTAVSKTATNKVTPGSILNFCRQMKRVEKVEIRPQFTNATFVILLMSDIRAVAGKPRRERSTYL